MEKRAAIFLIILPIFVGVAWTLPMVLSEQYILQASFTTIVLCIILYITHKSFDIIPSGIAKIKDWQNKAEKANFKLSDISQSVLGDNLFYVFVSCPENAFIYSETSFEINYELRSKSQNTMYIPSLISGLGGYEITPPSFSFPIKHKLIWRSNKKDGIRIYKHSPEIIDIFELNSDMTFSVSYKKNNEMKVLLNSFDIGKYSFDIMIFARDFRKKLFVQKLSMEIDFDGQIIKTIK
jgi:hypothetical protein